MNGKFITLEGGEGAGKSTQAKLLANWLRERGYDVVETREPGGTPGADAIRSLLLDKDCDLTPLAEAHLFAAARADHVETLIRPAIERGQWVICDRFVDSSLAYQGSAGDLGIDRVREINRDAIGDCWPNLTLLLQTHPDEGAARAIQRDGGETDRFSRKDEAFHSVVAQAFANLATIEPDRFVVVDASADIEAVEQAIRVTVEERLL